MLSLTAKIINLSLNNKNEKDLFVKQSKKYLLSKNIKYKLKSDFNKQKQIMNNDPVIAVEPVDFDSDSSRILKSANDWVKEFFKVTSLQHGSQEPVAPSPRGS